jgi:hypothetical protein
MRIRYSEKVAKRLMRRMEAGGGAMARELVVVQDSAVRR